MKQNHLKRILSWALALAILMPALPPVSYAAQTDEDFSRELSRLIQADNTDSYFDSMELTIGSNILTVDGEKETLDAVPTINGSRTMLPIRAVAENAGAEVDYEVSSKTVVITNNYGDEIRCSVGDTTMTVNNSTSQLDVAAYIDPITGRTYLPVRAVAEALNLEVDWDQKTSTVTFTAPYQTSRIIAWTDRLDASTLGAETVIHDGSGLWVLQFSSPGEAKDAAETLSGMGIIAEPDTYFVFSEPSFQLTGAAVQDHNSWGAKDCKFDTFINTHSGQFKDSSVVAVVDTGVDSTHPFLKGKVLSGWNYVDGNSNASDRQYHGTHVAATVIDCTGTAPVKILPVRVLDSRGNGYDSWIASGIKYAANHGADVVNLSLGGNISERGDNKIIDQAINYAVSKGNLVVVSAGNDDKNTASVCPAHITDPGVVVVSAGDSSHRRASFENWASNYGNSVDLMAPGVNILAAIPGGQYGYLSGTSMAAPHVSAAAVLLDLATGKTLSPAALEQKVRSATTNKGVWKNQQSGCGFLDLSQADIPVETIKPGISLSSSNISLEAGKSRTLTATVTPSGTGVSWSSSDTEVATVSSGKVTAVGQGTATVTAKIVYEGNTYTAKCSVTVSSPAAVEPGDWTTTRLPEKSGYKVETKEQYRSRNKELTESTLSSLSGWTLYDSKTTTSWGEWSEWKNGGVFNTGDNTQVETREVPGNTTTYYNLYYYKYWNAAAGTWYYSYSSSNGGTKYTARAQASDCVPYQSFDGYQAYSYNGFNLWWVESTDNVTIQNQQHRTRSKNEITTYYYYRWGDWSSWQDIPLSTDNETEVETRTLYRYVPTT